MSNQRYKQFQSITLPLAGLLMFVGTVALVVG